MSKRNLKSQVNAKCNDVASVAFSGVRNQGSNIGYGQTVTFNSAAINTKGVLNLATGVFTAPRAGIYVFSKSSFTGNTSKYKQIHIMKNGRKQFIVTDGTSSSANGDNMAYYWMDQLNAGDTLKLVNSGSYAPIQSNANNPFIFNGFLL